MKKNQRPPDDPKVAALRLSGTLHPHPDEVTAPLFGKHDFFDPRDTLQVKYEMLRSVEIEGQSVSHAADTFGCSRPTFYQTLAAFKAEGLEGLLPHKRGPQQAHKLSEEVLAFVDQLRQSEGDLTATQILQRIQGRFDLTVHRRSLERALKRRKKKPQ